MLPRNVAWIPFDVFKPVIFSPVICCWWFCKMDISEKQYVCIMHIMLFNFHINSWLCDPPSVYFLISKQKIYHSFVLLAATIYIYLCTIVLLQILWKPTPNFACYLIIWTTYHSLQSSADCPNMLRKGNGMSACFTTIIPIPPCFFVTISWLKISVLHIICECEWLMDYMTGAVCLLFENVKLYSFCGCPLFVVVESEKNLMSI